MNETVNKFLLAGDKFLPAIHLWQPGKLVKTWVDKPGCGPFIKNNERIQTFKETGDSSYIF